MIYNFDTLQMALSARNDSKDLPKVEWTPAAERAFCVFARRHLIDREFEYNNPAFQELINEFGFYDVDEQTADLLQRRLFAGLMHFFCTKINPMLVDTNGELHWPEETRAWLEPTWDGNWARTWSKPTWDENWTQPQTRRRLVFTVTVGLIVLFAFSVYMGKDHGHVQDTFSSIVSAVTGMRRWLPFQSSPSTKLASSRQRDHFPTQNRGWALNARQLVGTSIWGLLTIAISRTWDWPSVAMPMLSSMISAWAVAWPSRYLGVAILVLTGIIFLRSWLDPDYSPMPRAVRSMKDYLFDRDATIERQELIRRFRDDPGSVESSKVRDDDSVSYSSMALT